MFWTDIVELLKRPAQQVNDGEGVLLIATQVTELLSTSVKVSLVGGFVLAMPVILYQVVRFVAPGLTTSERRYLFLFIPGALLAFCCGLVFAYYVLTPRALPFLLTFGGGVADPLIRISNLVDVMLRLLFWMGLAFETPVIMYLLAQLGIVSSAMFRRFRKYWVVIAFILGAVITPTFDPSESNPGGGAAAGTVRGGHSPGLACGSRQAESQERNGIAVRRPLKAGHKKGTVHHRPLWM